MRFSPLPFLQRAVVLAAVLFAPTVVRADMVVVVVDLDKVVADVSEGKEARAALEKEQQRRQAEIRDQEAKLRKLQEQFEAAVKARKSAQAQTAGQAYQQAAAEYEQTVQRFNHELAEKEREYFDPVERKVKDVLRSLALREGYEMILSRRQVPFGRRDLDVTDRLTQEYDRLHPARQAAPAAPSPIPSAAASTTPGPATSALPRPASPPASGSAAPPRGRPNG